MSTVFAVLAALVPISASIFVAARALVRHKKSSEEFKVRARIEENFDRDYDRALETSFKYLEERSRLPEFSRESALRQAGLEDGRSGSEIRALSMLEASPLSTGQVRDQWILIWASLIGIVALAASLLVTS